MDDATIAAIPGKQYIGWCWVSPNEFTEEFGLNAQDTNTSDTGGGEAGDELHEHPCMSFSLNKQQLPTNLSTAQLNMLSTWILHNNPQSSKVESHPQAFPSQTGLLRPLPHV